MQQKLSREEIAKREIGRTDVSPSLARFMVAAFLGILVAVPSIQLILEARTVRHASAADRWPSCCDLIRRLPGVAAAFREAEGGPTRRVLAANASLLRSIDVYEDRLEDDSFLADRLLSPTQYALTRWGGLGNEKAYLGRDGWLFYRPGVDYLTGPGFLDRDVLARRASGGNEYTAPPHPDPRPAILVFREQLARSGVRLVLVPTPVKPMIEPDRFSSRYAGWPRSAALQNPSFERFKAEMNAAGVLVFDPAPALLARRRATGEPQYLATDTHWTPEAMQFVAGRLNAFLAENVPLPEGPAAEFRGRPAATGNLGDVAAMLRLPADQDLFPEQPVTIRRVLGADGSPWRPDPGADVLLLGDSFTNIYSMPEMGWGESAGFAEQLSLAMRRPIDRIAQNDAGAHATRQALARSLARGERRLDGLKVVVWQFAIRELAVGDWRPIPLPEPPTTGPGTTAPESPGEPSTTEAPRLVVRGRVRAVAEVPDPGSVPYRDAITAMHLDEVEAVRGAAPGPELVAYLWGMRDNRWTDAARYQAGRVVTLELTPWAQAQETHGRFTRVELDDPDFLLIELPTYWADEVP